MMETAFSKEDVDIEEETVIARDVSALAYVGALQALPLLSFN